MASFPGQRVSWYQKGKTSLDLNEARDDGVSGCSGISWTMCKQSASRSTQVTRPTTHHSIFIVRMLFLTPNQQYQSTEGKISGKHAMYMFMHMYLFLLIHFTAKK